MLSVHAKNLGVVGESVLITRGLIRSMRFIGAVTVIQQRVTLLWYAAIKAEY